MSFDFDTFQFQTFLRPSEPYLVPISRKSHNHRKSKVIHLYQVINQIMMENNSGEKLINAVAENHNWVQRIEGEQEAAEVRTSLLRVNDLLYCRNSKSLTSIHNLSLFPRFGEEIGENFMSGINRLTMLGRFEKSKKR